jgi:hypothetical protein
MHKLDDIAELQESIHPITGIKIDVENYEYHVLEGARALLAKYKPLIYAELWDNQNRVDCLKLLTGIGYGVFVLENGVLVKFDSNIHLTQNFFFQMAPTSKG